MPQSFTKIVIWLCGGTGLLLCAAPFPPCTPRFSPHLNRLFSLFVNLPPLTDPCRSSPLGVSFPILRPCLGVFHYPAPSLHRDSLLPCSSLEEWLLANVQRPSDILFKNSTLLRIDCKKLRWHLRSSAGDRLPLE